MSKPKRGKAARVAPPSEDATNTHLVPSVPADQAERDAIRRELHVNLVVEAAAGSGKTTCLVNRMVALLADGHCKTDSLAAMTFTRKAAGELRVRFAAALEREAADTTDSIRRARLRSAVETLDRAFIGTIHAFCARLLRDQPVEAGVDPAFREIDEVEDRRLRGQAWDGFVASLSTAGSTLPAALNEVGLDVVSLRDAFLRFADFPDVAEWPAASRPEPDFVGLRAALQDYLAHMAPLVRQFAELTGNDRLMPRYRRLVRLARVTEFTRAVDLMRFLEHFGKQLSVRDLVQSKWPGSDKKVQGELAKRELARWNGFVEEYALPALERWRVRRYPVVLQVLHAAVAHYDAERRRAGVLNYQDLLLKAALLLRTHGGAQTHFRRRYSHILVDEFQDTDPLQAEIITRLTAATHEPGDWRRCRPEPGALFVVGDPQQSIYRFRRADIVTYEQVKRIIVEGGGRVVPLTVNFRAHAGLVDWVNRTFATAFPAEATAWAPAYRAMSADRVAAPGLLTGVFRLTIPPDVAKRQRDVAEFEADVVARTIRQAIDAKWTLPRSARERAAGMEMEATAGDFLIVTRYRRHLSVFGRALEGQGIPFQITGGTALNELTELRLLVRFLEAVEHPEDPIALVAVLRSELFGFSDAELFAFRRAGGRFAWWATIPMDLPAAARDRWERVFAAFRRYAHWLQSLLPVAAFEKIINDLGLPVFSRLAGRRHAPLGSLAKILALVRQALGTVATTADAIDELRRLLAGEPGHDDYAPATAGQSAVRVMNLHKVKGLEAPIVFLADASGERSHDADLHVDRSEGKVRGFLAVRGGGTEHHPALLAHPRDWPALAVTEERFLTAEEDRLRYVAATRAGVGLIISQREGESANRKNPWQFFEPYLKDAPELQVARSAAQSVPPSSTPILSADATRSKKKVEQQWSTVCRTETVDSPVPEAMRANRCRVDAVHRLLGLYERTGEAADTGADTTDLEGLVDMTAAARAVWASPLWSRYRAAARGLRQVPVQGKVKQLGRGSQPVGRMHAGVVDLATWDGAAWALTLFILPPTDFPSHDATRSVVADHLRGLAELWAAATGQTVGEMALLYLPEARVEVLGT